MKFLETLSHPEFDARSAMRAVLGRRLRQVGQGRYRLIVPRLQGRMEKHPNMSFHLTPEVFLQTSGRCLFTFPEERIELRSGSFLIVPGGMPHQEKTHFPDTMSNLVTMFGPSDLHLHFGVADEHGMPCGRKGATFRGTFNQRLLESISALTDWFHRPGEFRSRAIRGYLQAYLATLLEAVSERQSVQPRESHKVTLCKQNIYQNLSSTNLSVTQLAKGLQCSRDYLSYLFHREVGMTVMRFIHQHRLHNACNLLRTSSMNVSEIAWACGYSDPGYFTRVFRRFQGCSPSRFRKRSGLS